MDGSLPVLLLDAQLVLQLLHGGAQLLRGRLELDEADLRLRGAVIGSLLEEEEEVDEEEEEARLGKQQNIYYEVKI